MNKYCNIFYIIVGFILAKIIFKSIGNNSLIVDVPQEKVLDGDNNCISCCQTCL